MSSEELGYGSGRHQGVESTEVALLSVFLLLFLLLALFVIKAFSCALRHLWHRQWHQQTSRFFYPKIHKLFFRQLIDEELLLLLTSLLTLMRLAYGAFLVLFLWDYHELVLFAGAFVCFLLAFVVDEFLARYLAIRNPQLVLQHLSLFTALLLMLTLPVNGLVLLLLKGVVPNSYLIPFVEGEMHPYGQLAALVQKEEPKAFDPQDEKLFTSVLRFRHHVAREVMVPRVDLFALAADTPIRQAVHLLLNEGYSRVPIYRQTIDEIIGLLMYKDLLEQYHGYLESGDDAPLQAPIETLCKPVLYIPETKKIATLLQEFRKKRIHLAIVVDEYGGTEGIVTIEDILEEIVGEIADEYDDLADESFYTPIEGGGWLVDARMTLLDLEKQLAIELPQEGEYDTLGGYLFHCAGTIPQRGFTIHSDAFEVVVVRSGERCVEQVRITPRNQL